MLSISRTLPVAAALALLAVSCGGSSDDASSTTDGPDVTAEQADTTEVVEEEAAPGTVAAPATAAPETAAPETAAPETAAPETAAPETAAPATDAPPTDPEAGASDAAASGAIAVSLVEWAIDAPTEYAAGEITFTATNDGNFPHEFAIIAGEGYESLPLAEGGAVIEDDLPTGALLGRTGRLGGGSGEDLTVTLGPGNYVLICNLGGGNNSHAGQGQRLDITVS